MTLKEKIARTKEVDRLKIEISNRSEAIRTMPGFAEYHKKKIAELQQNIADLSAL